MTAANDISTADRIRSAREAAGLSVAGLAYKAGVSYKTIERLEAGRAEPRPATLKVIELALAEEAAA